MESAVIIIGRCYAKQTTSQSQSRDIEYSGPLIEVMVPFRGTIIECGIRVRFVLVPRLQAKRPKNEVDLELFHEGNFRNYDLITRRFLIFR